MILAEWTSRKQPSTSREAANWLADGLASSAHLAYSGLADERSLSEALRRQWEISLSFLRARQASGLHV
jgi:hypothetical protein